MSKVYEDGDRYVKSDLPNSPMDILNRYLDTNLDKGSLPGRYIGVVLDNNDPEKLGRCKILVFGVFSDNITPDKLPWAIPEFGFVGSLKGSFIVPQIGAYVNVKFVDGEISLPKFSSKIINIDQLPTNKDKNYPDNMVFFETDAGDSFELDRSTSETVFTHNTGTTITISPDGSVTIDSAKNITTNHTDTLTVNGNAVTPLGVGPLNSIPVCPFSGALHTGISCSSLSTFDPENADLDREQLDLIENTIGL